MIADVEQPDGSYRKVEMGIPVCGEDFCDVCGDCLACYSVECGTDHYPHWVIYLCDDRKGRPRT